MVPPVYSIQAFSEDAFFQSLANPSFASREVQGHERAKYLFRYLQELGAETILLEGDYVDRDYLDDFASYYVKCFKPYERRCRRLHFFSIPLDELSFRRVIRGDASPQQLQDSYLGFIVARPLPNAIVGRTALKTYESDAGRRNYPCTKTYAANVFGIDLKVESLAFQEQDSVLAACATVALWCSFHKTAELFGTPAPGPAQITRAANLVSHATRPIPSHGLNVQQICNAIHHVGLEPEVIRVKPNTPLVSLIYAHLAGGLPVVLGLDVESVGGHAITVVGYSLQKALVLKQEVAASVPEPVPMLGLRINEFYAHDDQIGPFSRIEVRPSASEDNPVVFEGSWIAPNRKSRVLTPTVVIVPVYPKIRVTFLDIQKWLTRMVGVLRLLVDPASRYEWDVRLSTTNDFKKALLTSGLDQAEVERLRLRSHPRFMWRALLRVGEQPAMELLADATDMARSFPIYEVIWYSDQFRLGLTKLLEMPIVDLLQKSLSKSLWSFLKEKTATASGATTS